MLIIIGHNFWFLRCGEFKHEQNKKLQKRDSDNYRIPFTYKIFYLVNFQVKGNNYVTLALKTKCNKNKGF